MSEIKGKAWKFGDNINTDDIIPAVCLVTTDEKELAGHCFESFRPGFSSQVKHGDVIVAGRNFGCGSSREHAPKAIKGLGVSCVIAKSFARIFYRNAFNIGLPILESEEAVQAVEDGDIIGVDLITGEIKSKTRNKNYSAKPVPGFMRKIIDAGGLVEYVKTMNNEQ